MPSVSVHSPGAVSALLAGQAGVLEQPLAMESASELAGHWTRQILFESVQRPARWAADAVTHRCPFPLVSSRGRPRRDTFGRGTNRQADSPWQEL